MDNTRIPDLDARIEAAESRSVRTPDGKTFEIGVSSGTEGPSKPSVPGLDATVRLDHEAANAADRAARAAISPLPSQIVMPDNTVNEADVVTLGNLRLYPNPLQGWERNLTKGGREPYFVEVAGVRVMGEAIIAAVYEALKNEQAQAKRGKGK